MNSTTVPAKALIVFLAVIASVILAGFIVGAWLVMQSLTTLFM